MKGGVCLFGLISNINSTTTILKNHILAPLSPFFFFLINIRLEQVVTLYML